MKIGNVSTMARAAVLGAITVAGIFGAIGSGGGGSGSGTGTGTGTAEGGPSSFSLVLDYGPIAGSDVGGAQQMQTLPITWSGMHQIGGNGGQGVGKTDFSVSGSATGYASTGMTQSAIASDLSAGNWVLSINVNGVPGLCPSTFSLPVSGSTHVTFHFVNGALDSCTNP